MSRFGRRIAFDYGDVRIGVAVCDPDGLVATPLDFLSSKDPALLSNIGALIELYQPVKIYIGHPKLLRGTDSVAVNKAQEFAAKLVAKFDIEVMAIDERLSTVSAGRQLREGGLDTKAAKLKIDSAAAVAILEQGLAIDKR